MKWQNIMTQQFQMVYYANFSYADIEKMAVFERHWLYEKLVSTKEEEKEAREKSIEEAKRKSQK